MDNKIFSEEDIVSVECFDCGWNGWDTELIPPYQECPQCKSSNIEYID